MKPILSAVLATLVLASCSSTNQMSLSVRQPAPVTLPQGIRSVAVVNRSVFHEGNQLFDVVHKAVSLETNALQQSGAESGMQGLTDELIKSNRFAEVKPLKNLRLSSFGAGVFPSAMAWDSVEKICREANTDAVFSLELFDAESSVNYAVVPGTAGIAAAIIAAPEHQVSMTTNVKTGWRIYDPATRTILDEYVLNRIISFKGASQNPLEAASALAGRKEAVKDAGTQAGMDYADRILPYWIRVSREYFVKGDAGFTVARRKAIAGNWDGAAEIWKQEAKSANAKIAGRACYNMAIIEEINGNLDAAISWAQKSYEDYNIRLAVDYLHLLKDRKGQDNLLKTQTLASNP